MKKKCLWVFIWGDRENRDTPESTCSGGENKAGEREREKGERSVLNWKEANCASVCVSCQWGKSGVHKHKFACREGTVACLLLSHSPLGGTTLSFAFFLLLYFVTLWGALLPLKLLLCLFSVQQTLGLKLPHCSVCLPVARWHLCFYFKLFW